MEGIDRLTWKIALQLCQDVYGTILRANLEKFHDVMDILEKGDVLLPLKLFPEIVTTPFRFIVFVLRLHGGGMVVVLGSRGDQMWFRRGLRLRLNIGAFIHRNDADVLFHLSKNGVL